MDDPLVKQIPSIRFRLPHKYGALPALTCDQMTDGGLLIGQNAASTDVDAILIGKHAEAGNRNVWMDVRGAHVLYVMGKRRSGKSYTLGWHCRRPRIRYLGQPGRRFPSCPHPGYDERLPHDAFCRRGHLVRGQSRLAGRPKMAAAG